MMRQNTIAKAETTYRMKLGGLRGVYTAFKLSSLGSLLSPHLFTATKEILVSTPLSAEMIVLLFGICTHTLLVDFSPLMFIS